MNSQTLPAERCGNCAHRVKDADVSDPVALLHLRYGMAPCALANKQRAMRSTAPCAHTPSKWVNAVSPKH